jgi:hypothetical protein
MKTRRLLLSPDDRSLGFGDTKEEEFRRESAKSHSAVFAGARERAFTLARACSRGAARPTYREQNASTHGLGVLRSQVTSASRNGGR